MSSRKPLNETRAAETPRRPCGASRRSSNRLFNSKPAGPVLVRGRPAHAASATLHLRPFCCLPHPFCCFSLGLAAIPIGGDLARSLSASPCRPRDEVEKTHLDSREVARHHGDDLLEKHAGAVFIEFLVREIFKRFRSCPTLRSEL